MSNVPKLRFKEFSGEWEEKKLGEITTKYSKKNKENISYPIYSVNNKKGFVPQDEQFEGLSSKDRKYDISLYKIIGKNTFAYNPARVNVGSLGYSRNLENIIISSLYVCFKTDTDNIIDDFLLQYFDTFNFNKNVKKNVEGGVRDYLFYENFSNIKTYFPKKNEQKKISSFLNLVDTKIQKLVKKESLLKDYKRGVIQKIFNRDIKLKKDDGSNFEEWSYKNGNDIFETITNKKHNSDLPILAISQEYGAIPRDMIDYKITVSEKSVATYKVVEKGDYIISLRSFQGGIEYSNYKGICSPAYIILRPFIEINDTFFKIYFKTERYIKQLNRNIEGIRDGKMISYKQFSEIKLPYPCLEEQEKIANFLSSIDKKIEVIKIELEKTKEFKKALLQQMFV